ncbi:MAG: hypothetical protein FJY77_01620 [Candidatus Altiarchaeales archaeon]|nr:hypothetical protein [Candidatus Altiarchaeales archaeon]
MEKKAQASLEYMIMLALSLGIFAAILYVVSNLISTSSVQIGLDSAVRASNRVREAADFIYVHGHPSKTQVNVYIPPNVEDVSIIGNRSINIRVSIKDAYTDIYDLTKGTVVGDLSSINKEGYYVLSVESNPDNTINITVV